MVHLWKESHFPSNACWPKQSSTLSPIIILQWKLVLISKFPTLILDGNTWTISHIFQIFFVVFGHLRKSPMETPGVPKSTRMENSRLPDLLDYHLPIRHPPLHLKKKVEASEAWDPVAIWNVGICICYIHISRSTCKILSHIHIRLVLKVNKEAIQYVTLLPKIGNTLSTFGISSFRLSHTHFDGFWSTSETKPCKGANHPNLVGGPVSSDSMQWKQRLQWLQYTIRRVIKMVFYCSWFLNTTSCILNVSKCHLNTKIS